MTVDTTLAPAATEACDLMATDLMNTTPSTSATTKGFITPVRTGDVDQLLNPQTLDFKLGEHPVRIETGVMAKQAGGSVTLTVGETVLLVTATGSNEPRPGIDFFPLLCDFEERMYSVGKIPGGYIKREGRPSEKGTLICRLMDRPIRPLWPDGYQNDVQVVATTLSSDSVHQMDVLAVLGASFALTLSGLPFDGPIGCVRVGRINGAFVINPTFAQQTESDLDLIVAGTRDSIMMVEAGAQFVTEATLVDALDVAHKAIQGQCDLQEQFRKQCGVVKTEFINPVDTTALDTFVAGLAETAITDAYKVPERDGRKEKLVAAKTAVKEALAALADDHALKATTPAQFVASFKGLEKRIMREMVLSQGVRADGRKLDEVRPIAIQVGFLPRLHGSALFTRGNTQVLSIATLGAPGDKQKLDGVDPLETKRWMHHYNFPGYSTGEVRPMRGVGRREVGHGALAGRAIEAALPSEADFPYTLRVVSDVLESNGSSSMASTCGSSLALMDAGVPMTTAISGIAMGLILEGNRHAVLSDIQGLEDFLGDMDFKVTGNATGVTALQMDIKIQGISLAIMKEALEQARVGRLHILAKMNEAISAPREALSPNAPRILSLKIPKDMIGTVIGPGGKNIRGLIEMTGASIDIEDDGTVIITSVGNGGEKAYEIIKGMTTPLEAGTVFKGVVKRIIPIGAFVEFAPGREGMVHISQLSHERVAQVEDILEEGQEIVVKLREVDDQGRINLTIKGLTNEEREEHGLPLVDPEVLAQAAEYEAARAAERAERGPRAGGDRGGRGGFGGGRGPRR
ncbi:MAG: polyribonucleotide nucleotidyltransferase [Vampirovibrionales bacterium]|nr:polyribonucleotide nucleotidyltransferase [Vampirovibrionales bacterium]